MGSGENKLKLFLELSLQGIHDGHMLMLMEGGIGSQKKLRNRTKNHPLLQNRNKCAKTKNRTQNPTP